jgi:cyanate permease
MGAIFGALSVADGLGFGTGPLMAGYIFDTTGSYQMSFFIVAGAMAVALAATLALREKSASDRTKG